MNDLSGCRPMADVSVWELSPGSSGPALGHLAPAAQGETGTIGMWLCWTSTGYKEAALAQITAAQMWQNEWICHSGLDYCCRFEECVWWAQAGGTAETGSKWCLVNCRFCRVGFSWHQRQHYFLIFLPCLPSWCSKTMFSCFSCRDWLLIVQDMRYLMLRGLMESCSCINPSPILYFLNKFQAGLWGTQDCAVC